MYNKRKYEIENLYKIIPRYIYKCWLVVFLVGSYEKWQIKTSK